MFIASSRSPGEQFVCLSLSVAFKTFIASLNSSIAFDPMISSSSFSVALRSSLSRVSVRDLITEIIFRKRRKFRGGENGFTYCPALPWSVIGVPACRFAVCWMITRSLDSINCQDLISPRRISAYPSRIKASSRRQASGIDYLWLDLTDDLAQVIKGRMKSAYHASGQWCS